MVIKNIVPVRPRIPLRPFHTFQEVEQLESEFLLRLDEEGNIGLFKADGGMWKLTAQQTVKAFLEAKLAEPCKDGVGSNHTAQHQTQLFV